MRGPLVGPAELAVLLEDVAGAESADVRLVDCRFSLTDPGAGRQAYLAGHLPGAVHADLDRDLSGARRPDGLGGRHPLPAPDDFAAWARRAGISAGTFVVAYDEGRTGGAARLWWLLRHHGHDRVAVLDGGLGTWDGPLEAGPVEVPPGSFTSAVSGSGAGGMPTVDADELAERLHAGAGVVLLDARRPERYRGEVEPIDARPGHIPGARNLPFDEAWPPPEGLLHAPEQLVVSCGSGVTACVVALSFAAAGRTDVALYPGSYSDWIARGLPVAIGEEASGTAR